MKTRRIITTKPHRYGTRRLVAGEEYEAPARHALALVAGKKARFSPEPPAPAAEAVTVEEPAAAASDVEVIEPAGIDGLRAQARALGIEVDGRWGLARLHYEISRAVPVGARK